MTNTDLQNKLAEILGIKESEKSSAWTLFREKTTEILEFYDAIRIDRLEVFQLKSKLKQTGVVAGGSGEALIFAPEEGSGFSGKAWLTIELPEAAKDSQEFDESVFSLGINKTTEESYPPSGISGENMIRKDLEERVVELISSSEFIDSFDIWQDKIAKVYTSPSSGDQEEPAETEEPQAEDFSFDLDEETSTSGNLNEEDNLEIKKALEEEEKNIAEDSPKPEEEKSEILKPEDQDIFKDFNFEDFAFDEEKEAAEPEEPQESEEYRQSEERLEEKTEPVIPPYEEESEAERFEEEEEDDIDFFDLEDVEEEEPDKEDVVDPEEEIREETTTEDDEEQQPEPWDWAADDETVSEEEEIINDVYGDETEEEEEIPEEEGTSRFQRVTAAEIEEEPESEEEKDEDKEEEIFAGVPSEEELESGVSSEEDKKEDAFSDFEDLEETLAESKDGPVNLTKKSSIEKEKDAEGRGFKKGIWVFFFLVFLVVAAGLYYFLWYAEEVDSGVDGAQQNVAGQLDETSQNATDTAVSDNLPQGGRTETAAAGAAGQESGPEPVKEVSRAGERELYIDLESERMVENLVYSDGNNYYVQLHSFRTADQAERVARSLREEGQMAFIMRTYVPQLDATYNRVVIGEFKTLEEARQFKRSQRL